MSDRHAHIVMGCDCSPLAVARRRRPEDLLGEHRALGSETLGRFPHVERLLFAPADRDSRTVTHVGSATRPVRLLPAAAHELWAASQAKP